MTFSIDGCPRFLFLHQRYHPALPTLAVVELSPDSSPAMRRDRKRRAVDANFLALLCLHLFWPILHHKWHIKAIYASGRALSEPCQASQASQFSSAPHVTLEQISGNSFGL